MQGFAKFAARSATGIISAVILILNLITLPAWEGRANAAELTQTAVCDTIPSMPAGIRAFATVQCAVHSAIFGEETNDPATGYSLYSFAGTPGTYTGHDYLNRVVTLAAYYVGSADLKTNALSLYQQGWEAYCLVGRLTGPSGNIGISGVVLLDPSGRVATGYCLLVTGLPSAAELSAASIYSRINAGVQVMDTNTGHSVPLAELTGLPTLWGNAGDVSTLFCGCGGDTGSDPNCGREAYDTFRACIAAALATAVILIAVAAVALDTCLTACVVISIGTGPFGFLLLSGCALACVGVFFAAVTEAMAVCTVASAACYALLVIQLRACGITLTEA